MVSILIEPKYHTVAHLAKKKISHLELLFVWFAINTKYWDWSIRTSSEDSFTFLMTAPLILLTVVQSLHQGLGGVQSCLCHSLWGFLLSRLVEVDSDVLGRCGTEEESQANKQSVETCHLSWLPSSNVIQLFIGRSYT